MVKTVFMLSMVVCGSLTFNACHEDDTHNTEHHHLTVINFLCCFYFPFIYMHMKPEGNNMYIPHEFISWQMVIFMMNGKKSEKNQNWMKEESEHWIMYFECQPLKTTLNGNWQTDQYRWCIDNWHDIPIILCDSIYTWCLRRVCSCTVRLFVCTTLIFKFRKKSMTELILPIEREKIFKWKPQNVLIKANKRNEFPYFFLLNTTVYNPCYKSNVRWKSSLANILHRFRLFYIYLPRVGSHRSIRLVVFVAKLICILDCIWLNTSCKINERVRSTKTAQNSTIFTHERSIKLMLYWIGVCAIVSIEWKSKPGLYGQSGENNRPKLDRRENLIKKLNYWNKRIWSFFFFDYIAGKCLCASER